MAIDDRLRPLDGAGSRLFDHAAALRGHDQTLLPGDSYHRHHRRLGPHEPIRDQLGVRLTTQLVLPYGPEFCTTPLGSWATPEIVQRFAARADEEGYRSLWAFQRLLHLAGPDALDKVYRSVLIRWWH